MIELIKKTMLAGVGATVVTKETVEEQLQALVNKGKITNEEAKKTVERITGEGREEYEKIREETEHFFEDILRKGTLVTKSQLEGLSSRISTIEEKLGISAPAEPEETVEVAPEPVAESA